MDQLLLKLSKWVIIFYSINKARKIPLEYSNKFFPLWISWSIAVLDQVIIIFFSLIILSLHTRLWLLSMALYTYSNMINYKPFALAMENVDVFNTKTIFFTIRCLEEDFILVISININFPIPFAPDKWMFLFYLFT